MRRRNIFWLAVLILGGFFILNNAQAEDCATSTGWGSVKINEVSTYSSNDWVEVYNLLGMCVDLTGLKLWDSTTSTAIKTLSGTTTAHGWSLFDVSNRLNRDSDSVVLKNNLEELDRFDYGTTDYPSAGESEVWARNVDGSGNWELTVSSTPGAMNITTTSAPSSTPTSTTTSEISTTTLWAKLKINEVAPDSASGNEWVEFFNPSTTSLDLIGGYLCDSRGATSTVDCKDLSGSISALGWLKFDWAGYFLNNDSDEVILRNPAGEAVDQIVYGEGNLSVPEKGQALARKVDGVDSDATDDWSITTQITPGEANIITAPAVDLPPSSGGGSTLESPIVEVKKTTTSTTKTTTATAKKIKEVGLIWKVKYDPRVRVGTTTILDAFGTLDPRGGRIEMNWNVGEGAVFTGEKIIYSFVSSGLHDIVIYATSTAGTMDKKQIKIMVYPNEIKIGAGVVVDKILPNTVGADDGEYVAVKNITSSTINISNWKILTDDKIYSLPTSTFILSGDNLIFYHAVTGLVLTNTGGMVELRDENDILVDELIYGKAKEGQVMGDTATPGTPGNNIIAPPVKKITSKIKNYGRLNLAAIKNLEIGSVARARGVVTVLPGILGSQFFYISDGQIGLQIYQYKKDFPELKIGDEVEAQGAVSVSGNIKRLRLANKKAVDILSTENSITPLAVELGELDETQTGNLIKIKGEITEIKSNFMYVDDGTAEAVVYFKKGSAIDKKKILEGEKVEVTGILEQAKTGPQLWPRSSQDIVSLGPSEDLLKKQQLSGAGQSSDTAEKYLTATAGGLTTLLLGFLVRVRGALIWGAGKRTLAFLGGLIKRG